MNKHELPWLVIALAVVTLLGIVMKQNVELRQMRLAATQTAQRAVAPPSAVPLPPVVAPTQQVAVVPTPVQTPTTIAQHTVYWNNQAIQFEHRCVGQPIDGGLFAGSNGPVTYCIGVNQLIVTNPGAAPKVLVTTTSTGVANAPLFEAAELVSANTRANDRVLLTFRAIPCHISEDDCGAGLPRNYVSYVYNPLNTHISDLENFPKWGHPIWNADASKAIFVTEQVGGAGVDVGPLNGYNMRKDSVKALTTVVAGAPERNQASRDVNGDLVPQWGTVTWTSLTTFTAAYLDEQGRPHTIKGTF